MVHLNIRRIRAFGMAVGSVIGAGVFGIPYAFAQSGFGVGMLILLVLGAMLLLLQLMYAEVALQTPGKDRMVGYVRRYLGEPWGWITLLLFLGSFWSALIAYIIIGGTFLDTLFAPIFDGPEMLYALLMAGVGSALIYRGLRFASRMEMGIVATLLFLFAFIILAALPHVRVANLTDMFWPAFLTPYGVVLFALSGLAIVPEIKDVLGSRERKHLPHIITTAMFTIVTLYAAFSFAVVGVTGEATTPVALIGLSFVLGDTFRVIGALLGAVTILSIFFMVGIELMKTLEVDFKLSRPVAWLATCGVPILLYVIGVREFIGVMGFAGAVFSGLIGIITVCLYDAVAHSPFCRTHHCLRLPRPIGWLIVGVFAVGVILEISAWIR